MRPTGTNGTVVRAYPMVASGRLNDGGYALHVHSCTGVVACGFARKPGQHINILVLSPGAVVNFEVVLLQQHLPPRVLTGQVPGLHKPRQGLMIGDEIELGTVQVCSKRSNCPS
jgi:hypothetical protein